MRLRPPCEVCARGKEKKGVPSICWCNGQNFKKNWGDPLAIGVLLCVCKQEGGRVFQLRVINHWSGSKKKYEGFRTNYINLHCIPPLCSYTHTHPHIYRLRIFSEISEPTQPGWMSAQNLQAQAKKKSKCLQCLPENVGFEILLLKRNKAPDKHTQRPKGHLVEQGQTFPVLVNFCLCAVVVTSAPCMNSHCLAKKQRRVFLLFVLNTDKNCPVEIFIIVFLPLLCLVKITTYMCELESSCENKILFWCLRQNGFCLTEN